MDTKVCRNVGYILNTNILYAFYIATSTLIYKKCSWRTS